MRPIVARPRSFVDQNLAVLQSVACNSKNALSSSSECTMCRWQSLWASDNPVPTIAADSAIVNGTFARNEYFTGAITTDSANSVQLTQAGSKFGHIEGPGSSFEGLGVCFQTFSEANKQVSASESFRFGPTPRLSAHKYRAYAKLTVRCDTLWRAFS